MQMLSAIALVIKLKPIHTKKKRIQKKQNQINQSNWCRVREMKRTIVSTVNRLFLEDLLKKDKEILFFFKKWLPENMNLS